RRTEQRRRRASPQGAGTSDSSGRGAGTGVGGTASGRLRRDFRRRHAACPHRGYPAGCAGKRRGLSPRERRRRRLCRVVRGPPAPGCVSRGLLDDAAVGESARRLTFSRGSKNRATESNFGTVAASARFCEPRLNESAMNIAVFLPNWIGDVVMATPALRALRDHFADAHFIAVCRPYVEDVLQGSPWFDDHIELDTRGPWSRRWLAVAWRLRRKRIDLAVLFPNSFRSALVARLGGCRRRVGYRRYVRGWLLTDALEPVRDERRRIR